MKRPPLWLAVLLLAGFIPLGWTAANAVPPSGSSAAAEYTSTVTLPGGTTTIRRVTRGRVVTLPGGTRVVRVPLLIVRTDDHVIRVPAHFVKLRRVAGAGGLASSTVGTPLVPVTVTVYLPGEPVTVTATTTTTEVIVSTVTLPLTDGGTPEQEAPQ